MLKKLWKILSRIICFLVGIIAGLPYIRKEDLEELKARARRDRGRYEAEVSFRGEADLHKSYVMCDKNPGHDSFIPVSLFKMADLPDGYHDDEMVDLVKAMADITVRVSLQFTSNHRPQFYPGSSMPYPFHQFVGSEKLMRTGTGFVCEVIKHTEVDDIPCDCNICELSPNESAKSWGQIWIRTAAHVVFDSSESEKTTCHFFYDDSNKNLTDLLTLKDFRIEHVDIDTDLCEMIYHTHDMSLVDHIYSLWHRYVELHYNVNKKYSERHSSQRDTTTPSASQQDLTIVVSHPHGCNKQISIGKWAQKYPKNDRTQYTYTTPTCPGSSGAPVYMVHKLGWFWDHPHSATCDERGLNLSGYSLDDV